MKPTKLTPTHDHTEQPGLLARIRILEEQVVSLNVQLDRALSRMVRLHALMDQQATQYERLAIQVTNIERRTNNVA